VLLSPQKTLHWTFHARDKMRFYRLSEQRVRSVLHSPKRIEEGVAPKTVAMMQPASIKFSAGRTGAKKIDDWTQEIWVMVEDKKGQRKVISAWRYPGKTKPRSEIAQSFMKREFASYIGSGG
jgi:hypothetical protein